LAPLDYYLNTMLHKFPIPPWQIISIIEELGSNKIELVLRGNGWRIKATKQQFDNYEYYKEAVRKYSKERNSISHRPRVAGGRGSSVSKLQIKSSVQHQSQEAEEPRRHETLGNNEINSKFITEI